MMTNEVKFGCNLMSLRNFRDAEPALVKTIVEKKHAINLLPVLINASKEMEKERVGNERGEEQRDGLMSARTGLARDL